MFGAWKRIRAAARQAERQQPVNGMIDADGRERERRDQTRFDFMGRQGRIFIGLVPHIIHIRDVSATGASGVTDAPVSQGQVIGVAVGRGRVATAVVCWNRKSMVGLNFLQPLDRDTLLHLHKLHMTRKRRLAAIAAQS